MLTSCSVCSHAIWCEVRSIGAFCFVVYFNDEQSSNTYMEPVTTCPGCISALFAYRVEGERVILRTSPYQSSKKFNIAPSRYLEH